MASGDQDWPGVDYRCGRLGDSYSEMANASHRDKGVLRRRPGFLQIASGQTAYAYDRTTVQDGKIVAIDSATGTGAVITPATGAVTAITDVTPLIKPNGWMTAYAGTLFHVAPTGSCVIQPGTATVRTAGLTAPANTIGSGTITPSVGLCSSGTHVIQYRYKNATRNQLSNPSGAITLTLADLDSVSFSIGNGTGDIWRYGDATNTIILEVTLAGGSEFYAAVEVADTASSITLSISDLLLAAKLPASVYGEDGHGPMPGMDLVCTHRSRVFGYQASTNLLAWSRPGYPESWDITTYARAMPMKDTSDPITALVSFLGDMYVFTKYTQYRFLYVTDPAAGTFLQVPTAEGLWNPRCAVLVDSVLFGFGPNGAWATSAITPEHISVDIDPFVEANIDTTLAAAQTFGWYNRDDRSVTWVFPTASGVLGITFSLRTKVWVTRSYNHALKAQVATYGASYLMMGEQILGKESIAAYDGIAAGTTVNFVTKAGSTTTRVYVTAAPVAGLVGTYLTVSGESRLISAVGADYFDCAALSGAPAAALTVYAASVPIVITSENNPIQDLTTLKRLPYLVLEYEPAQDGVYFEVQILRNFDPLPLTWTIDVGDTPPAGVAYTNNSDTLFLDSTGGNDDGYVAMPMSTLNWRTAKIKFKSRQPVEPFGLTTMRWMTEKPPAGAGE